jgi:hypothetical protein
MKVSRLPAALAYCKLPTLSDKFLHF